MFLFWEYYLDGVLLFLFLFLPSKVYADAINNLQYRGGKMATMSEMSLKMGLKFDFERNISKNIGYQEKLHHKWVKKGKLSWLFH